MTREEMLNKLHTVSYDLIDPPSEWEDVGFTERPIWVNNKGYGYIQCDEPLFAWEGQGIDEEIWKTIKKKLAGGTLCFEDIENTSIVDLLETYHYGEFDKEDNEELREFLRNLLLLEHEPVNRLYCLDTMEGFNFFATEKEFLNAYERDWCDFKWEDLEDDILACWIERLFN